VPEKVLFAGDANIDFIFSDLDTPPQEDREVFCKGYTTALGGSGTITAAAYARLGGSCDFCGLLGDDANGSQVMEYLRNAGVGLTLLRRMENLETGITVSMIHGSTRTQVTYRGNLDLVDETEILKREMQHYGHIHLSGIYGTPQFLPNVTQVLQTAHDAGLTTSLDTQWDPSQMWKYADQWFPYITWLFVNESEAISLAVRHCGISDRKPDWKMAWEALVKQTPCPIIKLGPKGSYMGGELYPPVDIDHVYDPTGAGDSFAAAFLYATIEAGQDACRAIHLAQAAGALACTFPGGNSESFTREKLYSMVVPPLL